MSDSCQYSCITDDSSNSNCNNTTTSLTIAESAVTARCLYVSLLTIITLYQPNNRLTVSHAHINTTDNDVLLTPSAIAKDDKQCVFSSSVLSILNNEVSLSYTLQLFLSFFLISFTIYQ